MKKSNVGNIPGQGHSLGHGLINVKKITSKIDTGRRRVVTGTLTTTTTNLTSVPKTLQGSATSLKSSTLTLTSDSGKTSTFPRSQKVSSRPCPPSKDPNIRAFVQANSRLTNMTALFHDEVDPATLSAAAVRVARKSGVLNLSGRNLLNVPLKVWRINELDENERGAVSVSLDDNNSEDKWWEFVDLQKLIIANNYIKAVPCDVANLVSLQTFDAHDNQITTVSKDLGKLSNLSKLDLGHNELKELPEEIGNLTRLVELKLGHNCLEEVPPAFGNLASLRILDISHNKLTTFPGDLGFLSFLQNLNLSNNKITELPEEMGGLTGLRTLDVSDNCLKSCPAALSELVHLEILYLQRNKLDQVPDVSKAKSLKEIYLQNNLLREINSESFSNTKLNLLDLRSNKIDELQIDCEDLEFLDRFYLDNNNLTQLPDELALLPSLKALTLDGNPIRGIRMDILQRGTQEVLKYLRGRLRLSESFEHENGDAAGWRGDSPARNIPDVKNGTGDNDGSFADLRPSPPRKTKSPSRRKSGGVSVEELGIDPYKVKGSRTLGLASRQIVNLEVNVFQLAADCAVTCIDLSKNSIVNLPSSIELCQEWLAELKLDFNRLYELPPSLSKCSRLQYLSLQNNQLSDLPQGFSHLKSLREINLGYNKLGSIPPCLYELPNLEIINMASNKLVALEPKNLEKLKKLAVLDVRNNNIVIMPPEIGLLTQLKSLSIEGNAFRVPNYSVISSGTDSIMAYLRNRIIQ